MATTPLPQVFVGYLRCSTEEQAISALGLGAQEARVRALAASQTSEPPELFVDAGFSGSLPASKRPGLSALLRRVERLRGRAVVVVYRLDRLARSALEMLRLEHELRRRRIRLLSASESFDSTTASGRAYLAMIATFAEFESSLIAERTFAAMRTAVGPSGARVGGPAPIGYALTESGAFMPVEQEADAHASQPPATASGWAALA